MVTRFREGSQKSGQDTEPERQPSLPARRVEVSEVSKNEVRRFEDGDSATVLEGLDPVDVASTEPSGDNIETLRKQPPISPRESGIFTLQREERTMSRAVIATAWIVTTAALMLLTYYLASQEEEAVELRADSQKVTVAQGTFLKGLDEQVRAFILMTCQKMSDDQDECEEDRLLAGEYPEEEVELDAFEIDNLEVTNSQWNRCIKRGKCAEIDYRDCKVYTHQGLQVALRVPKSVQEPQMPVVCVTRNEAAEFCEWAGGALPTHDQWERAARGTDGKLFPWGDAWVSDHANWGEVDVIRNPILGKIDGYEWSAPPGVYGDGKSDADAYDMAGNVAEWVAGDGTNGYARGGSWASNPFELRTTGRLELDADERRADVGFRCAY